MKLFIYVVFLVGLWGFQSTDAQAQPKFPKLTSLVYDETQSLAPNEVTKLEQKLRAFEDSTTAQVAIMIVRTLDGYPAGDFATEAANANKLGQAEKNNGVLILLAIDDREWFIAVGYGLESSITDPNAARIGRDFLVPELKEGKYFAGLNGTVDAIINEIKNGPDNEE